MAQKIINWSYLPDELVDEIANHLFSDVELLRLRSLCKYWRSAVETNKLLPICFNRNRKRLLYANAETKCSLYPATFSRVVLSSSPNKGWLIKTRGVSKNRKKLVSPLSRFFLKEYDQTLDLLDYTVSEIHQSYHVEQSIQSYLVEWFDRVVLVNDMVFVVDKLKKLKWCNSGETSNTSDVWTRILDEEAEYFCDIIVHQGQIYALDLKSAIWWISLSTLNIYQFGPSVPMDEYDISACRERRIVEYCGDLYVVHRFCKTFYVNYRVDSEKTIGFKVYKMDGELVEWVEIKSLGDKAFVMATDSCFSVSANEYYGCLESCIYFIDEEDKDNVKVFKLSDGSITKMVKSSCESCFQMFCPCFG